MASSLILITCNRLINGIIVKQPNPSDPDNRNFTFGGILADCGIFEPEICGEVGYGHHQLESRQKKLT
jgi:hypothetical protein